MKTSLSKVIVITGSTRGIGYGLAEAFLERGCKVVICGRSQANLDQAVRRFQDRYSVVNVFGVVCDVGNYPELENLWNTAIDHFGQVDIWINNAGIAHELGLVEDFSEEMIDNVVTTNLTGMIFGSKAALIGMRRQGFGSIYNMEGLGSDGNHRVRGLTLYATTKAALRYFNDSLMDEVKDTAVMVGALAPGMVVTDLLLGQRNPADADEHAAKRIFNILADKVETVTPWLADKILANTKNGVRIKWMTSSKATWRFLSAPFVKRNVLD
jgi:NAD(P)-dependent dehydrogenase (short-subunit alcohol dehydrogenase family)